MKYLLFWFGLSGLAGTLSHFWERFEYRHKYQVYLFRYKRWYLAIAEPAGAVTWWSGPEIVKWTGFVLSYKDSDDPGVSMRIIWRWNYTEWAAFE